MYLRNNMLVLALIVSLATPAFAAGKAVSPAKKTAPGKAATEKTFSSQQAPKPGVVALVNGAEIGLDVFTTEVYRAERLVLDGGRLLTAPQVTRLRADVLEVLVRQELLFQESKKTVKVTDAEIGPEVEKLKDQFRNQADFAKAVPALRVQVERALAIRKYIDSVYVSKAVVADTDIRSYYDGHRDAFRAPEQVRASYIFVKVDPQWDETKKAEAKKKIEDVRKKALGGQDFASLARTYSEDPTAPNGGDMGYVRQGQLLKPVEDALFTLKTGEVSDVVETRLGCHLVKVVERKPETTVPFENVKDQLRAALKQEKGQQEANAYIAKVRQKAVVQTFLPPEQ
jgi:peptidyl-prolyl cis-trans isomerase C